MQFGDHHTEPATPLEETGRLQHAVRFRHRHGIHGQMRSDLTQLCEAALEGRLATQTVDWDPRAAVGVVLAAAGYPDTARKGDVIEGLDEAALRPGKIFHAGTARSGDSIVTAGGRVLCAVGLGDSVLAAQRQAYDLVRTVRWPGMQYRTDIGHRAIERERH